MAFLNATLHYIAMLAHLRELTARGISSNRGDLSDSQIQGLPSWSAAKHVRPRSVICSAATKRAKDTVQYVCPECGASHPLRLGKCQSCNKVVTMREEVTAPAEVAFGGAGMQAMQRAQAEVALGSSTASTSGRGTTPLRSSTAKGWLGAGERGPQSLNSLKHAQRVRHHRIKLSGRTGAEINRVLGGGVVQGSLVLVGGDPGVGKSTLLLQIAAMLADPGLDYDAVSDDSGLYSSSTSSGTALTPPSSTDGTASAGDASTGSGSDQGSDMGGHYSTQLASHSNGVSNGNGVFIDANTTQGSAGHTNSSSSSSSTNPGSQAKPRRRSTRVRSPSAAALSFSAADALQGPPQSHAQQPGQQQQYSAQDRPLSPTPQGEHGEEALRTVLYVSGEEMEGQISERAGRMGLGDLTSLFVYSESRMDQILRYAIQYAPTAVVIDSIQTMHVDIANSAGSVVQLRECGTALLRLAKDHGITVFAIGHVTKESELAGPKALEHMVDAVLKLEGDMDQTYRLLRATKNRYGTTDEVGIFSMDRGGLHAVDNPSAQILANRSPGCSALAVTLDGSRVLVQEVQALVTPQWHASNAPPMRTATGADIKRLQGLLIPVIQKFVTSLSNQNVVVNVTGGLQMREPAADLALAAAIVSSLSDTPLARDVAFVGEVDLGGGLRPVKCLDLRLAELRKQGLRRVYFPQVKPAELDRLRKDARIKGLELHPCATLLEALTSALGGNVGAPKRGHRKQQGSPEGASGSRGAGRQSRAGGGGRQEEDEEFD